MTRVGNTLNAGAEGSTEAMGQEPDVTRQYRKDADDERFLEKLNDILGPVQDEEYADLPERYPTLHVIGVPRSGTTLVYQLIASHLSVGYINNLIAAFWRAPVYGIRLSKKLLGMGGRSNLESEFGRTEGIREPHEFGYFWTQMLGYRTMQQQDEAFEAGIDWEHLARVFKNMTHAFGAPVAFKSFQLGWHIERLQQVLPQTCFVWIRRDPVQNALSLLKMRRQFLGSVDRWASFRPREYDELREQPVSRQVAGQVFHLERSIAEQVARVDGRNVLELHYADLCRDPAAAIRSVRDLLGRNGADVTERSEPARRLEPRRRSPSDTADYRPVEQAVEAFYEGNRWWTEATA